MPSKFQEERKSSCHLSLMCLKLPRLLRPGSFGLASTSEGPKFYSPPSPVPRPIFRDYGGERATRNRIVFTSKKKLPRNFQQALLEYQFIFIHSFFVAC